MRVEAGSHAEQAGGRARDRQGQAALEFALALPVLLAVLVATVAFGIAFNNYLTLTYADNAGAQLLSISRGTADPCAVVSGAVINGAPNLTSANLTFKVAVGNPGTPFTATHTASGTSCTSMAQYLVAGNSAQVTTTYPCNLALFGFNPAPNCTLSAQTTVYIQ